MSKFLPLAIFILALLTAFSTSQKPAPIILQNEKIDFTPHEFYIAGVVDERRDKSSVASLITANSGRQVSQSVDLQGGAANAIKSFIDHNLHQDTKLHPIIITIKEFKLAESNSANGRVSGNMSVVFSFGLRVEDTTVHLLDYTGGIRYARDIAQTNIAEPALRHSIENALLYFNKWINSQADTHPRLATSVHIKFTDYTEKNEGDTIYYSVSRPLVWDDFKDKPRVGRFDAEIFASIGYAEQIEVIKGIINVNISVKVDVPKSDCWVRDGARNDYALNHEQRHFDIEKLVSEHFKQKILAIKLPVDNFDGPINVEYLEILREATRRQKQYDAETNHGSDRQAQAVWNEKIDGELRAYGVKK